MLTVSHWVPPDLNDGYWLVAVGEVIAPAHNAEVVSGVLPHVAFWHLGFSVDRALMYWFLKTKVIPLNTTRIATREISKIIF